MSREWYELGLVVGFGALYILFAGLELLNLINMLINAWRVI